MSRRCPHCGMDSEGRGIMAADPNAGKTDWVKVFWTFALVAFIVVCALAISPTA